QQGIAALPRPLFEAALRPQTWSRDQRHAIAVITMLILDRQQRVFLRPADDQPCDEMNDIERIGNGERGMGRHIVCLRHDAILSVIRDTRIATHQPVPCSSISVPSVKNALTSPIDDLSSTSSSRRSKPRATPEQA